MNTEKVAVLSVALLVSGISLALTSQIIWGHSVHFNLFHDYHRQTVINFIMFLATINAIIAYPSNATQNSVLVSNVTTLFSFTFVQYGLVMINHNSLARWNAWSKAFSLKSLNAISMLLYLCPLVAMIPIYLAVIEKFPSNQLLNQSSWNIEIWKPMTMGFVVVTEVLATISDVGLLMNVYAIRNQLFRKSSEQRRTGSISSISRKRISSLSLDLATNYIITWFFLLADIFTKVLIMFGYPFLFDSILSITTIALRSKSNIIYGLNMKEIFEESISASELSSPIPQQCAMTHSSKINLN